MQITVVDGIEVVRNFLLKYDYIDFKILFSCGGLGLLGASHLSFSLLRRICLGVLVSFTVCVVVSAGYSYIKNKDKESEQATEFFRSLSSLTSDVEQKYDAKKRGDEVLKLLSLKCLELLEKLEEMARRLNQAQYDESG